MPYAWEPPRGVIDRLYRTAHLQRWTDHIRPLELTVLGKHAHMMGIFWLLSKVSLAEGVNLDYDYAIRGSLYELLRKSVITDMKSQVFDRLAADSARLKRVNEYAFELLADDLGALPGGLAEDYQRYFFAEDGAAPEEKAARKVLRASSSLAMAWEFRAIRPANAALSDLASTARFVREDLLAHADIPGFLGLAFDASEGVRFVDVVGRLRLQLRWSDAIVTPLRPVLDHSLVVAYLAYLGISALALSGDNRYTQPKMKYIGFFGGLFHDLPEALTRDIIHGVKKECDLDDLLDELEEEWLAEELEAALGEERYAELARLSLRPFEDKPWEPAAGAKAALVHPGSLLKACDVFSAFMEAWVSVDNGTVSSRMLEVLDWGAEEMPKHASSGIDFSTEASGRRDEALRKIGAIEDEVATAKD